MPWRVLLHPPRSAAANNEQVGKLPEDWTQLLGRKVSIRYRLHDGDHAFSEAIGVVQSVTPPGEDAARVTVVNRRGEARSVPIEDIVTTKVFSAS